MFAKLLRAAAFLSAAAIATTVAAQDELSGGDKKWMEKEVGAIITDQEKSIFQQIRKDDRKLFKEIFWMRRDFDPRTSENEYEDVFKDRVKIADDTREFKPRGGKGSESEMGMLFVLLGTPDRREQARAADLTGLPAMGAETPAENVPSGIEEPGEVEQESRGSVAGGNSNLMTWVYNADPQSLTPNGLVIEFRRQQNFGFRIINEDEIRSAVEGAKARLIANPGLSYARNSDGRLAKPDDKFDPNSPAKQALAALRQTGETSDTFVFDVRQAFFRSSPGSVYIPLEMTVADGIESGQLTVFGSVENADGIEVYQFEESGKAQDADAGSRYELPLLLEPGLHTLYVGVMNTGTKTFGTKIIDVEVPDFDDGQFKLSSVLMFGDAEQTGEAMGEPGKAFLLGGYHFKPKKELVYSHQDSLSAVFNAYNYGVDGETPKLTWEVAIFKGTEPRGKTGERPFLFQNAELATNIVDIPMNIPHFKDPGEYKVEITVTDHVTGNKVKEEVNIVVEGE